MRYAEVSMGRVFIMRMEHGENLHRTIEDFARDKGIASAAVMVLGGADDGSRLVVGPEDPSTSPIEPIVRSMVGVNEISGVGTLFNDDEGNPILHLHVAAGRGGSTLAGCTRAGVSIWQVAEVVIFELVGTDAVRRFQEETGFVLLQFDGPEQ